MVHQTQTTESAARRKLRERLALSRRGPQPLTQILQVEAVDGLVNEFRGLTLYVSIDTSGIRVRQNPV